MENKDLLKMTVKKLIEAMEYYNYALMKGSFSQWQVALAKYETLRDLLIDSGHTFEFTSKTNFVYTSPRMLFTTIIINGKEYTIPEYDY